MAETVGSPCRPAPAREAPVATERWSPARPTGSRRLGGERRRRPTAHSRTLGIRRRSRRSGPKAVRQPAAPRRRSRTQHPPVGPPAQRPGCRTSGWPAPRMLPQPPVRGRAYRTAGRSRQRPPVRSRERRRPLPVSTSGPVAEHPPSRPPRRSAASWCRRRRPERCTHAGRCPARACRRQAPAIACARHAGAPAHPRPRCRTAPPPWRPDRVRIRHQPSPAASCRCTATRVVLPP